MAKVIPKSDKDQNQRAKEADLVVLPKDIAGTKCGNCMYFRSEDSFCFHKAVMQNVKPHWCCIYWDAPGVERVGK